MLRHVQPRFLVLEGLDGTGTSTQSELLRTALQARDLRVRLTAEPSDGPLGRVARAHVKGEISLDAATAALAFVADRSDHLERVVRPALAEGEWVVSDRYVLSTLAYQGADGVDREWILAASGALEVPDLTVFLDLPEPERADRVAARGGLDRYEAPELAEPIRASYLASIDLLRERGHRVAVVDASGTVEDVLRRILAEVDVLP